MLQFIRDRAQGWIAWVIVGLIIIPFALWGLNEYVGGPTEIAAAEVNGQTISQRQLQESYYRQRQRLQEMFGEQQLPEDIFSETAMKKQLIEQLIEDELLLQSSFSEKMRISDQQLVGVIRSIDSFQENSQFSNVLYESLLRQQGLQPATFEFRVRRDLLLQQYRSGIEDSEFATDIEAKLITDLSQQLRDIEYITVPIANFENGVTVNEDEIERYYEANQTPFRTPEMVKVSYIELKQKAIASEIDVDESLLQERYESQIINYRTAEERRVRHILITDEDDSKARQDADQLLVKIRSGEPFEELARTLSQDPGSAAQGGDLGFFGRGLMDPAFEAATYGLNIGEVSPVVKSEFGYHIIRLEEIRGGETKSFADVKSDILAEVQQERAEQRFYDQAESLANFTYEQPDTLQVAAEQLNLTIQTTPFFGRSGGQGVAKNRKFSEAAFSADVLQRGNNSEVIELSKTDLVVLRLETHQPEGIKPFDSVKTVIKNILLKEKMEADAQIYASTLLEKANGGEPLDSLAKEEKLQWQEAIIKRDAKEIEQTIVGMAFKMAHPEAGSSTRMLVTVANGDQVIVSLNSVDLADDVDAAVEKKGEDALKAQNALAAFNSVAEHLRRNADIEVNQ